MLEQLSQIYAAMGYVVVLTNEEWSIGEIISTIYTSLTKIGTNEPSVIRQPMRVVSETTAEDYLQCLRVIDIAPLQGELEQIGIKFYRVESD